MESIRTWFKSGLPWVWLNAAAVSVSILLVVGLLGLIAVRGLVHFWPAPIYEIYYQNLDGGREVFAGQVRSQERVQASRLIESGIELDPSVESVERLLLKTGNRDLTGEDFRWVLAPRIEQQNKALSLVALEREEWGVFFGRAIGLKREGELLESRNVWGDFQIALERTGDIREQIQELEKGAIGSVNYRLERLRLAERKLELKDVDDPSAFASIEQDRASLQTEYQELEQELLALYEAIGRDTVIMQTLSLIHI